MRAPRLRTVNKAVAPFDLNKFPTKFIDTFAKEIVYIMATKSSMSLEGTEWEQIFAKCIGAEWKPSNVGLDDIVLDNCCWGAKTVFGTNNIKKQKTVRLISGRNSPIYSYGVDNITSENPNEIGKLVLDIWNERVSAMRQIYKFVRTVVLVKSKDYSDYLIFEFDTIRYDPELYYFKWNVRMNLEGYEKASGKHKFTWQPSGSQFTIIENIPNKRLHISIKKPQKIDKETILKAINFDSSWYQIVSDHIEK
ncbi:hypothetical protein [Megamonas hypermegale]|uniref:hypothetical protein n=1 Tax=Megamonas hypermegale TaxID=158847 RepID=UPI00255CE271|nr:hypothetical protein [Megamonas hypermegale]